MRAWTAVAAMVLAACDGAAPVAPDARPTPTARCGDGIVDVGEYCDDGNGSDVDECATDCTPAAPFRRFDAPIVEFMNRHGIPGGTVAVTHQGRLVLVRAYGVADRELGQPMVRDQRLRIASLSKLITAVAILQLVEQGALGLDDSAFAYLDGLPSPTGGDADPRLADVTVRQLLQHRGGWDRRESLDPVFASREIADSLGEQAPADADAIVRWMRQWPLQFDPGTRQRYSNFGYVVLGRIIDAVTGESYESWTLDHVLAPAGAGAMYIGATRPQGRHSGEARYHTPPDAPLAPHSVFPDVIGEVPWPYGGWYHRGLDSAGGWVGSAVEFASLLVSLDRGTTLDPTSLDTLLAPPPASTGDDWYAMGVQVHVTAAGLEWSHAGEIPGSLAVFARSPDGFTRVGLFNLHTGDWGSLPADADAALREASAGVDSWPDYDLFERYR